MVNETLTPELALGLGKAIGTHLRGGTVGIAMDPRTSNRLFTDVVVAGLVSTACEVVEFGMVPTPALQFAVKTHKLAGGVVITASHNPPEFNGIKCIDGAGMECSRADEEAIEAIYFDGAFDRASWDSVGPVSGIDTAAGDYVDAVVSHADAGAFSDAHLRVALDCGNGATCATSPAILEHLGCEVRLLNGEPDGTFPGRKSEPTEENLAGLLEAVAAGDADLGVAHDGDGDRTIFVDGEGRATSWGTRPWP